MSPLPHLRSWQCEGWYDPHPPSADRVVSLVFWSPSVCRVPHFVAMTPRPLGSCQLNHGKKVMRRVRLARDSHSSRVSHDILLAVGSVAKDIIVRHKSRDTLYRIAILLLRSVRENSHVVPAYWFCLPCTASSCRCVLFLARSYSRHHRRLLRLYTFLCYMDVVPVVVVNKYNIHHNLYMDTVSLHHSFLVV